MTPIFDTPKAKRLYKYEIKNRWSGETQATVKIDLGPKEPDSLRLGAAVKAANLAGANLDGANLAGAYLAGANLAGANLDGANLDGANLARAYLAGAYLDGANLARAYLAGAYLAGANLAGAKHGEQTVSRIIQGPTRSDGYHFLLFVFTDGNMVRAGCRSFTLAEYRAHAERYGHEAKRAETVRILDYLEAAMGGEVWS